MDPPDEHSEDALIRCDAVAGTCLDVEPAIAPAGYEPN